MRLFSENHTKPNLRLGEANNVALDTDVGTTRSLADLARDLQSISDVAMVPLRRVGVAFM